jgi:hypothetical protein
LILNGNVGQVGSPANLIEVFAEKLNEKQKEKFEIWQRGFQSKLLLETTEKEWTNELLSHPAINLLSAYTLKRMGEQSADWKDPDDLRKYLQNNAGNF